MLPLLLGWIGCATFERGQTLVPSRFQIPTGQFLIQSNSPLTNESSAVRCLQVLEEDVLKQLGLRFPATKDPVSIYVLDDRNAFDHFLKFYYPELPPRRAFFIAQGEDRVVYTYSNPRLEEDLRHEGTHALIHGAFGDIPLWLDEGLAEYFETDLSHPGAERPRLEQISADLRSGWTPNLGRLESLNDIRQMNPRDYREAWGWIHLLLNGPESAKTILMSYLRDKERTGEKSYIAPRLAIVPITDKEMLAHLEALQGSPMASSPARDPGSVRLKDDSVGPPVRSIASPPGILRRIRAWIGFANEPR